MAARIIRPQAWNLQSGYAGKHVGIVHFLRESHPSHRNIPTVFETCKEHDIEHVELVELFPTVNRRSACRLAGLPFFA
jgi:sulfur relay (sulfurtransferase) DsrC/TusE family protein